MHSHFYRHSAREGYIPILRCAIRGGLADSTPKQAPVPVLGLTVADVPYLLPPTRGRSERSTHRTDDDVGTELKQKRTRRTLDSVREFLSDQSGDPPTTPFGSRALSFGR